MRATFIIVNMAIVLICIMSIALRVITYAIAKDNALKCEKYKIAKYNNVYAFIFKLLLVTVGYCIAIGVCAYTVIVYFNNLKETSRQLRILFTIAGMCCEMILIAKAVLDFNDCNNQVGVIRKKMGAQNTQGKLGKIRISIRNKNGSKPKAKEKPSKGREKARQVCDKDTTSKENKQQKPAGALNALVKDIVDVNSSFLSAYVNNKISTKNAEIGEKGTPGKVQAGIGDSIDTSPEINVMRQLLIENKDKSFFKPRNISGIWEI